MKDLGAVAGDCLAWVRTGFHPGKEEQQRNPTARIVFDFGSHATENPR
jgi:hypothetical protein